ncbi:MAG: NEW3 domain-containing protein [Candidatus Methanoperedens sp.]|nr:NEW3 domain-containing protein [Candidatus Methanoperedens sp.]
MNKILKTLGIIALFTLLLTPITTAEFSPVAATTDITGKVVRPGDTVEFTTTLQKGYNTTKSVSIKLFIDKKPDNWLAGFYADNNQISQITFPVDSTASKQVILRLRVPPNTSDGSYLIRIGLQPYGEDVTNYDVIYRDFAATVDRNAMPDLDIYSAIPGRKTHPGSPVKFGVTVENKYDSRATVKLSVLSKPSEWGIDLLSSDGARITKLSIPAKGKQELEVAAQPPINAADGDYEILIGASMESGSQIISLPLSISINPDMDTQALSAYLEMSSAIPGLEVRPENVAEFIVSLKNRYDQHIKLNLKPLSKPEGWNVEFLSDTDDKVRLTTLDLPARGEQKFNVKVKPALNASDGIYPILVGAVSEEKSVSQRLEITVNKGLERSQILSLYPSYSEVTLNPGSSTEIRVTLRNGGNEALSNVQLEIQDVSGISTQIRSFGTIEKLEAGESRSIPVEITARADAGSGIKEIFMRARSGDVQGEEKSIKVNVEKSGSSGVAGIGMVVLAVAALVFIIRKFGRR